MKIVLSVIVLFGFIAGCTKETPKVKPKNVQQPSVYKTLHDAFNKVELTPVMFKDLKHLHDYVTNKPGAKDWKPAASAYGWAAVRMFAKAFVEMPDKVESITGGTRDNSVASVDFANQTMKMAEKAGDKKLKKTLQDMVFLFTDDQPKKGQIKALYATAMDVPELRIFLITKLTKLIQRAMNAPEALRSKAVIPLLRLLPPVPKGVDPGDYALQQGGKRLVTLARTGIRAWAGIAHPLAVVIRQANIKLSSKRVGLTIPYATKTLPEFSLPEVKEPFATPGSYLQPIDVLTIGKDAVYFGTRPVMFLNTNSTGYFFGSPDECWPGKLVFTAKEIRKKGLRHLSKFEKKMEGFMDYADRKEVVLTQGKKMPAGLNKDRTNGVPGRSVLIALDRNATATMLKSAMQLMYKEHYTDFRLVRGDDHNKVVPVLYRQVLPLKKMPPKVLNKRMYVQVKKDRIVLTGTGFACKARDTKKLNPIFHVKITKGKGPKVPTKMQVVLKTAKISKNTARAVGEAASLIDNACGSAFFVNVAPYKGVQTDEIFQVAYGLVAYGKKRVGFFPGYFPGLGCGKAKTVCMAHIPVLFGPAGPPRKTRFVETRPLGFCDKDDIKKTILKWGSRFRYCYESQLQRSGGKIGGRLQVRFVINPKGKVERPEIISDTVGNKHVTRCVRKIIRRLKFKKPQGGICVVQWPFVFRRQ